jgi:hypothetical protein
MIRTLLLLAAVGSTEPPPDVVLSCTTVSFDGRATPTALAFPVQIWFATERMAIGFNATPVKAAINDQFITLSTDDGARTMIDRTTGNFGTARTDGRVGEGQCTVETPAKRLF